MDKINQTLYIPLYGKARVSKSGVILSDGKAEELWEQGRFPLRGKAKSKWLAYFMAMRARVFDDWTRERLKEAPHALVLQIGCGLDSRILRVGAAGGQWYDVDLPDVIAERRKHFAASETYHMLGADASQTEWVGGLPGADVLVVLLEGLSMYLKNDEVKNLFQALREKYAAVRILMDVYTSFGAKASKYKNPINTLGVTQVYGVSAPGLFTENGGVRFVGEHTMTPRPLVDQLSGFDKAFFSLMFAGKATGRIYRLLEYEAARE